MAPKNLVSRKRRQQDEEQTLNHPNEEQSDQVTDSDPDLEAEEVAAPPKKTKSTKPLKLAASEPLENGSACSSPSASGFLIVPSQKPSGEKEENKMKKKAHASKVFSHDDVIAMLKGLAEFWANGRNNKWAEFHLFIKDVLRNQFTKIQVSEKIRSLKRKFDTNLERARANGGHIDLADPHELAVFELSKALWSNDEKGIAPEKVQIAENEDEKENEMRKKVSDNDEGKKSMKKRKKLGDNEGSKSAKKKKKKKQVDESDEESKSMKKQKQVDESDEESKGMKKQKQVDESDEESKNIKRRKQVDESREVSKKEKNRKQLGELGEENKKMNKLDHGIEELVGGDERDAANTILSIRKMVNGHGEGIKKKKKRKHADEHDENRELLEEGTQEVNGHDEANKTPSKSKHVDERGKGNKKKRKQKQVDELDEANKTGELKEVDEPDEANKTGEQKEVDKLDEQKGVDDLDEANKTGEQKEADEHVEKKEIVEKAHKVDLHVEGEHVNEHEEQGMTTRKKKRVDGDKGLAKKRKDAYGHHEENNMPANYKQEMRIRAEDFQSAYPLLYASFHTSRYPRFNKGNYTLIGQENAQELEEKWRELNAEMHRLELKKLDLMMRDSHRLPGK